MNQIDCYSDDQSKNMYPFLDTEKWINVHLTISPEQYHSEIYDLYLDKMIHQMYGFQNPYENGHPPYSQCPICNHFDDIVIRRYSRVGDASTQFTITVSFPDNIDLFIHVEEKRPDKQTIQLHFQVEASIVQTSYVVLKKTIKTQDFLLSWMNSLLMELQKQSKIYQENQEFETIEKEVNSTIFDALHFLRSSLY